MDEADDLGACPVCEKDVVGHAALLAHLEFSHQVADGEGFLRSLGAPASARPWSSMIRRAAVGAAAVAVAVVGVVAAASVLLGGADEGPTPVAAAEATETPPDPGAAPPTPSTTTTTTVVPTTAPPTTAVAPTTTPPTSSTTTTTTTEPVDAVDPTAFRKPFVTDAVVASCTSDGAIDRYVVSVTFSGAREIVFDGIGFPDETGDGGHEIVHETAAGTGGYLDHVTVADGAGEDHRADIAPPLYLGGC